MLKTLFFASKTILCLIYLLTEFGQAVRENLARGKRLIVIFRYSRPCYLSIYLVPLDVLYRFCDSTRDETNNAHLQKFNCPTPPPTSRQWTYVIQGRECKGHMRPVRPFWTEIYYMGVIKNQELKWSFVGALTLSNPIYERGYVLISHRASSPGSPPVWILPSPFSHMVWYPRFKIKMKWMSASNRILALFRLSEPRKEPEVDFINLNKTRNVISM